MTEKLLRRLLDACFIGKRITELIPPLPKGLKPRHIHVIEIIHLLQEEQEIVRVSDVSDALHITTPSVTKLINELFAIGAVEKHPFREDKRITALVLTPLGVRYYQIYIQDYHSRLMVLLKDLPIDDCETTFKTLESMYEIIKTYPIKLDAQE